MVDVTAPQGRDGYGERLQALLELGADGFKIDGGDHKYHPPADVCAWHDDPGASGYSDRLLALFDDYEGCAPHSPQPFEYERVRASAWFDQGQPVGVWAYVYCFPVRQQDLIASGSYAPRPSM